MKVVIQVAEADDAKAWALLQRHSPGVALPNRTFVVSEEALTALRGAGVRLIVFSVEEQLKRELDQEEILIVEKEADVL
ncbi:MAG: hypothetical protein KY475_14960 [Planctomycetes bacterium]|nr:hypothetical protein [Planctomycetota bacterium]